MNNKIYKLAILAVAISSASVMAETPATVTTILGADQLVITEDATGFKAVVTTEAGDRVIEQKYSSGTNVVSHLSQGGFSLTGNRKDSKSSVSWDMISGGLGFGFCSAPGASQAAGIEMGKSFELSWLNILAVQAKNRYGNSFSLGVGINWRNYRTTLGNTFVVNNGQVEVGNYPEGVDKRLSRIKIFSVQFPLLYTQSLPFGLSKERMALKFGPIFNLNSHASVLTTWHDGDRSSEYKVNGINIRPFTIDLFASLHLWECVSLYARYSPYHALTGHRQPNFHQFSTGIMLFM